MFYLSNIFIFQWKRLVSPILFSCFPVLLCLLHARAVNNKICLNTVHNEDVVKWRMMKSVYPLLFPLLFYLGHSAYCPLGKHHRDIDIVVFSFFSFRLFIVRYQNLCSLCIYFVRFSNERSFRKIMCSIKFFVQGKKGLQKFVQKYLSSSQKTYVFQVRLNDFKSFV